MTKPHPQALADTTTNELLAMLEVMYLVASADNDFSPQERRKFLDHAESLSGGKLDSRKLAPLVGSWEKRDLSNVQSRLAQLSCDLPDVTSRRIAYGLAQELADADGETQPVEAQFLAKLALAFGLDDDESEEITQSVRMSQWPKAE